ncbi:MAG: GC-type dockerin domain-anchored protein [Phycisphaerales bacterium]
MPQITVRRAAPAALLGLVAGVLSGCATEAPVAPAGLITGSPRPISPADEPPPTRGDLLTRKRIPGWTPQEPSTERGEGVGFEGIPGSGWYPPDSALAVGAAHLVAIVNGQVAFFEKDGTNLLRQTIAGPSGFWAERGAGQFVFDPEALYDPHHDRFWLVACEQTGASGHFTLAASATSSAAGAWHKHRIDVTDIGGADVDSPNIAAAPTELVISADFEAGGDRTLVYILPTQPLLDGEPLPAAQHLILHGVRGAALVARPDTSASAQYLLEAGRAETASAVTLHAVQSGASSPAHTALQISVPEFRQPGRPTQAGSAVTFNLYDARFWTATLRQGSIWAAHAVRPVASPRTVVRWYEFRLNGWPGGGAPSLRQWGEIDPGGDDHAYCPSITADAEGNAALTYTRSGPQAYPAMWSAERRWLDPLGTLRQPALIRDSSSPFTVYDRWGDYSTTAADPADPCAFWGHSEWTTSTHDWRTWIARYENHPAADANLDCHLNVADFSAFLVLYAAGDPRADMDQSGNLNVADFGEFLAAYASRR